MRSTYGKAKYCPTADESQCLTIGDITKIHAESRDPDQLLDVWKGWRTTSTGSRADYQRFAKLMNQGSQELGFKDTGELWRSAYDMDPDEFAAELDRLWDQVLPLYESLQCYTRKRLADQYGEDVEPLYQPIPAHLFPVRHPSIPVPSCNVCDSGRRRSPQSLYYLWLERGRSEAGRDDGDGQKPPMAGSARSVNGQSGNGRDRDH